MPLYETTFVTRQDLPVQEVEKITHSFAQIIQEHGGSVVRKEYWGLRSLAYIVKKNRKGYYVHLGLDAPYGAVKEMERRMGLNENIIRKLTLKVDQLSTDATVMMTAKQGRDDDEAAENKNNQNGGEV